MTRLVQGEEMKPATAFVLVSMILGIGGFLSGFYLGIHAGYDAGYAARNKLAVMELRKNTLEAKRVIDRLKSEHDRFKVQATRQLETLERDFERSQRRNNP